MKEEGLERKEEEMRREREEAIRERRSLRGFRRDFEIMGTICGVELV